MKRLIQPLLCAITAACAMNRPTLEERTLANYCSDIAVIGRIKNGDHEHVEIEGDILGHGWTSATIKLRRVVRGPHVPNPLPVRYFTHANFRQDKEFLFVLRQGDDGIYQINAARLMSMRPMLAAQCL